MRSSPLMAASPSYLEQLFLQYRTSPDSIDASWVQLFEILDDLGVMDVSARARAGNDSAADDHLRDRGHVLAATDPLSPTVAGPVPSAGPGALYTGRLTLETAHIDDDDMRLACRRAFEMREAPRRHDRLRALDLILRSEAFEQALGSRYPTKKRFGSEGAEAILPLLDRVIERSTTLGVRRIVIGMMHRGRMSMIANVLERPLDAFFAEIIGAHPLSNNDLPADVPYHSGHEAARLTEHGRPVRVRLLPNPSHLEAINPVAAGTARAWRDMDGKPGETLCILLHTDASVIAQGSVAELLQLSAVDGFTIDGTIHLIINNQIGFTTNPSEARSSHHCTGQFKAVDCPILHVNGDSIDDVLSAADLAADFRQRFARDTVVDLVCYRRNGHNEIDEPRFTHPDRYTRIDQHPAVSTLYADQLETDRAIEPGAATLQRDNHLARIGAALDAARAAAKEKRSSAPVASRPPAAESPATGLDGGHIETMLAKLATPPAELSIGRKVRQLVERRALVEAGLPWATAEALAFASLLEAGTPVRLTGQDVVRGAFSHRHFALTDERSGQRSMTLATLSHNQAAFTCVNSPLSEYAVLGFEYGYSLARRGALTIWEAQFGDFANGAQIVIDQFIASGGAKWGQASGLVVLLPHGLEGQGPEHSSARPERFLQLAADDNFEVVHPSTPANYFHLLRRQVLREARRPLIVLSPKTLIRLPAAVSPIEDFGPGRGFEPVIASYGAQTDLVLICSGKIAYELEAARDKFDAPNVAVLRLESLYPLAEDALTDLFRRWPDARFRWVQEEPRNFGAWSHLDRRLEHLLERAGVAAPRVECISRPEQSSPAGSFHARHDQDQAAIVEAAFAPAVAKRRMSLGSPA